MYKYADKAIKQLNKLFVRWFTALRLLKFDEINILSAVKKVYADAKRQMVKRYESIAVEAYRAALKRAGSDGKGKEPDDDWLLDMLEETDPVTLYQFFPELERKTVRLAEALEVPQSRQKEIDRALRYLSLQMSETAIRVTDEATIKGYFDSGVKRVRWVAREDERTCPVCGQRHNRIYPINRVPPKPHYGCRCEIIPVLTDK